MSYTEEQIQECFDRIITHIQNGGSLRSALKLDSMPSSKTFYIWLEDDEERIKQYARACETRSDVIFEEILDIADDQEGDVYMDKEGNEVTNHNVIQRARLRVDARKWMAGKMNPKKYGDSSSIDITTQGDKIGNVIELREIKNDN